LHAIGEGGMGAVYMAEQETPVRRRLALKIIKPGMDSDQLIARFEVECQVLAMMDHPHIAKVLDAGAAETGRHYFVMELVKGMPIIEPVRQRGKNRLCPRSLWSSRSPPRIWSASCCVPVCLIPERWIRSTRSFSNLWTDPLQRKTRDADGTVGRHP
jgi:serine/threonine protein kinase